MLHACPECCAALGVLAAEEVLAAWHTQRGQVYREAHEARMAAEAAAWRRLGYDGEPPPPADPIIEAIRAREAK